MAGMDHGSGGGMQHSMRDFSVAPQVKRDPSVQTISPMPVDRMGEPGQGLEDVGHKVLTYHDLVALERNPDVRAAERSRCLIFRGRKRERCCRACTAWGHCLTRRWRRCCRGRADIPAKRSGCARHFRRGLCRMGRSSSLSMGWQGKWWRSVATARACTLKIPALPLRPKEFAARESCGRLCWASMAAS